MSKLHNDILFYYNKYLENIEICKHLFEIKELNLKDLKIINDVLVQKQLCFNVIDVTDKPIYYVLVIKQDEDYVLFDDFNQFKTHDLDVIVKCIILPNNVFEIKDQNIDLISNEHLYFEDIYLNISDFYSKFFIMYPYKKLLNEEYKLYIIKVYDYINLLEAISNLIQLINQKLFILNMRGAIWKI